jgi:hypothetical protein
MSKTEQQRQRKLAKKQAKDRAKHKMIARKQNELSSLAGKIAASSRGKIVFSGISQSIQEAGIGYVVLAREGVGGLVVVVCYLVDLGCLGVKDIATNFLYPSEAREQLEALQERGVVAESPEMGLGLVHAAVAYAQSMGFEPYADYRKVAPIWGDIVPESVDGKFEFGREGKPFYCSGPFDDAAKRHFILQTLEQRLGAGGYHFTVQVGESESEWADSGAAAMGFDDDEDDDDDFDEDEEFQSRRGRTIRRID